MGSGNFMGLGPVNFEPISGTTATNSTELGTKVTYGGCDYVYVHNAADTPLHQYHGCILSAVSGYSVTISSVSGRSRLFGVAAHATIPTGNYGWVMTRGFANVANARTSSALTAGADLYLSDDGKFNSIDTVLTVTNATQIPSIDAHLLFAPSSGGTGTSYALAYVAGMG
jgi:hypothetical protein